MSRKSTFIAIACASAIVAAVPGTALAWHAGTHAYVADQLRKSGAVGGEASLARLYGANGPDLFNYSFAEPYRTAADYLHDSLGENAAERLWSVAVQGGDPVLMEYAYGFASHDNAFGADFTAHKDAVTGGWKRGYVIEKAEALAALIGDGLPVAPEMLPLVTHLLVEFSVDVLVRQELDPAIGQKLLASTAADPRIGALLATAFADPLAPSFGGPQNAAGAIGGMDAVYRAQIIPWYASALASDDPFVGVATWVGQAAKMLLGIDISRQQAEQALYAAMELCRPDYQGEIFATIGRTNANLSARDILP